MSAGRATKLPASVTCDECQPLLAASRSDEDITIITSTDPEDQRKLERSDELGWKLYTFYGISTAVGLLGLTLLIKRCIHAGDEFDLRGALMSALGGGLSGAAAMVLQVLTLMPLRTVMNYQYRYGTTATQAVHTLYEDGGWTRYYQGLTAALIQGPVSRFGDTAANAGILALLQSNAYMKKLPILIQTIFASLADIPFRMILTPVDTVKTTLQTQGRPGMRILRARVKMYGIGSLWYGALATAAATFIGHYPWFGTYNYLEAKLPIAHTVFLNLIRHAFIGFIASVISDCVSNSLRVVKTYRQVNETRIGYIAAAQAVIAVDGISGLLGRGLKTRILANGLQGVMFSILWRFLDLWNKKTT
ncbi:mitochondrial carrier [Phlegmacium glaucopus]|nr:mitochondrial carrier [Phlegmacium glaucopus]